MERRVFIGSALALVGLGGTAVASQPAPDEKPWWKGVTADRLKAEIIGLSGLCYAEDGGYGDILVRIEDDSASAAYQVRSESGIRVTHTCWYAFHGCKSLSELAALLAVSLTRSEVHMLRSKVKHRPVRTVYLYEAPVGEWLSDQPKELLGFPIKYVDKIG